jgi:hypothetical protein
MKKNQTKKFRFLKVAVARLADLKTLEIKGGTAPTGPNMTEAPDDNNICWAEK